MFQDHSEREARNFALGRDSDDLDAALRDMGEIFSETMDMLAEKAAEFGIDLDKLVNAGPRDTFEEAKKAPLDLIMLLEGRDFLEDITWHHTVVSAKVFRAIGSEDEPEIRSDAVNSATVDMNSLTICIMAIEALAQLYPMLERERKRMSLKAPELKRYIRSRFGPCS